MKIWKKNNDSLTPRDVFNLKNLYRGWILYVPFRAHNIFFLFAVPQYYYICVCCVFNKLEPQLFIYFIHLLFFSAVNFFLNRTLCNVKLFLTCTKTQDLSICQCCLSRELFFYFFLLFFSFNSFIHRVCTHVYCVKSLWI